MQFACKLDLHALEQELGFRPAGRRERGEGSRGGSRYRACNCPISLAASGCSTASSASAAAVARSWADPLASRPSSTTHSSSATGGTASDRWVDVTQQREHDVRRQMRAEPDGSGHRDGKCRPLYPATPDDPFHASRGLRASDLRQAPRGQAGVVRLRPPASARRPAPTPGLLSAVRRRRVRPARDQALARLVAAALPEPCPIRQTGRAVHPTRANSPAPIPVRLTYAAIIARAVAWRQPGWGVDYSSPAAGSPGRLSRVAAARRPVESGLTGFTKCGGRLRHALHDLARS